MGVCLFQRAQAVNLETAFLLEFEPQIYPRDLAEKGSITSKKLVQTLGPSTPGIISIVPLTKTFEGV